VNNFTPILLQRKMLLRTPIGFSSCNEKDFWGDQLGSSLLAMKKTCKNPNWVLFLWWRRLLRTPIGFSSCNEKDFWGDQLGSLLVIKRTSREPNWVLSSCYEKGLQMYCYAWCLRLVTSPLTPTKCHEPQYHHFYHCKFTISLLNIISICSHMMY
jgi:hypothetical protein